MKDEYNHKRKYVKILDISLHKIMATLRQARRSCTLGSWKERCDEKCSKFGLFRPLPIIEFVCVMEEIRTRGGDFESLRRFLGIRGSFIHGWRTTNLPWLPTTSKTSFKLNMQKNSCCTPRLDWTVFKLQWFTIHWENWNILYNSIDVKWKSEGKNCQSLDHHGTKQVQRSAFLLSFNAEVCLEQRKKDTTPKNYF